MISQVSLRAGCKQGRLIIGDTRVSLRGSAPWELDRAEIRGVRCAPGLFNADLTIITRDAHEFPLAGVSFREAIYIIEALGYIAAPSRVRDAVGRPARRIEIAGNSIHSKLIVTAREVSFVGLPGWTIPRDAIIAIRCASGPTAADLTIFTEDGQGLRVEGLPFNNALHALDLLTPPSAASDAASAPAAEPPVAAPNEPPAPAAPEPVAPPPADSTRAPSVPAEPLREPAPASGPTREPTPSGEPMGEPKPRFAAHTATMSGEDHAHLRPAALERPPQQQAKRKRYKRPIPYRHGPAYAPRFRLPRPAESPLPSSSSPRKASVLSERSDADEEVTLPSGTKALPLLDALRPVKPGTASAPDSSVSRRKVEAFRASILGAPPVQPAPAPEASPATPEPSVEDAPENASAPHASAQPTSQATTQPLARVRGQRRHLSLPVHAATAWRGRIITGPRSLLAACAQRARELAGQALKLVTLALAWIAALATTIRAGLLRGLSRGFAACRVLAISTRNTAYRFALSTRRAFRAFALSAGNRGRAFVLATSNRSRALAASTRGAGGTLLAFSRSRLQHTDKRSLLSMLALPLAFGAVALAVPGDASRPASYAATQRVRKALPATTAPAPTATSAPSSAQVAPTATPNGSDAASLMRKVFVGSHDGSVYALSASDGHLVWRFGAGAQVESSPTYAGGVVYFGSDDGYVYAVRAADHRMLWRSKTGAKNAAPPAVANGVVYVGSNDDYLYALQASDGALLWRFKTGNWIQSRPAIANGVVAVGSDDGSVYALSASDGALFWSYQTGDAVNSSPTIASGVVYVGSADNNLYAVRLSDGARLWHYRTGGSLMSSPAVVHGVVYVGSFDDSIYALRASDGAQLWRYQTGSLILSSPSVFNGTVYVGSYDGAVYALRASDGALLWRYATSGPIASWPAVLDGAVYVGSTDHRVYALDARSGDLLWSYKTGGVVNWLPAIGA